MFGTWACTVPFSDGGRACRSKVDCQGRCLVVLDGTGPNFLNDHPIGAVLEGQCERTNQTFGCYGTIEGGKLVEITCED